MRTILLPFHGRESDRSAFDTAICLAKQFNSYVEGLFVRQLPPIIAGEGITLPGDYITHLTDENRKMAQESAARFRQWTGEAGLPLGEYSAAITSPCSGWQETEGLLSQVVAEYGRLFDLTIIGRNGDGVLDWKIATEAALFDSGRPIILASEQVPQCIGKNILVIWSGSTETTRSIALAMPFFQQASAVTLLQIEGATVPGPGIDEIQVYLARNGIQCNAKTLPAEGRSAAEVALAEAGNINADLLIKGAYTHSRLRAMIFGTVTSHILAEAKLPVFLAH